MALGKEGEVLVSATVRDSVAGKGIVFVDHGVHELKGLAEAFQVYDIATIDGVRRELPLEPDEARRRREILPAEPSRIARRWVDRGRRGGARRSRRLDRALVGSRRRG